MYECKLHTGRTHQIRVHLNYIGVPIIGDFIYKKNVNKDYLPVKIKKNIEDNFIIPKRQALHAQSIGFFHPFKKKDMFFESEEPKEFKDLILLLEKVIKLTKYSSHIHFSLEIYFCRHYYKFYECKIRIKYIKKS